MTRPGPDRGTDDDRRPTFDVKAPAGGWGDPWPNVAEIARVLPTNRWTLIGGLMTQLHAIHHGVDAVRPTSDVDIALHIETARGTPNTTANALESLGYELKPSIDPRNNVGHRFTRGASRVDVVIADHPAPRVQERMRRKEVVDFGVPIGTYRVPGGGSPVSTSWGTIHYSKSGAHVVPARPRPSRGRSSG